MKRTNTQNSVLHGLFSKLNIDEDTRHELVAQFTGGRTQKSSEMLFNECFNLIGTLDNQLRNAKGQQAAKSQYCGIENQVRRGIIKIFYEVGFLEPTMTQERKMQILNGWIKKKMNLEKTLNELSPDELAKMRTQLMAVRRIYQEKLKKQATFN